jgi:predicted RNase H-like nuclease (RuvC/YqgF family)
MTLELILTTLISIITAVGGYVFGMRKNRAEADSIIISNVKELLDIQSGMITSLKSEIDSLKVKIDGYEVYIENLETQVKELKKSMDAKSTSTKKVVSK